jgi:hypothetical protein
MGISALVGRRGCQHCTTYLYKDFQIEHTFLPPTDWEFVTTNARKEIIDRTWWGYEDGFIDVGCYIEKILKIELSTTTIPLGE